MKFPRSKILVRKSDPKSSKIIELKKKGICKDDWLTCRHTVKEKSYQAKSDLHHNLMGERKSYLRYLIGKIIIPPYK